MFKFRRSHRLSDDDDSSIEYQHMHNDRRASQDGSSSFSKGVVASKEKQRISSSTQSRGRDLNSNRPRSASQGTASLSSSSRRSRSSPPPNSTRRNQRHQDSKRRRGHSVGTEQTMPVTENSLYSRSSSISGDDMSSSSSSSEESGTEYSELDASTQNGSTTIPKYSRGRDDDESYPSVGVNVVYNGKAKANDTNTSNFRPPSRQAVADQPQLPNIQTNDGVVESLKIKPPSVLGTAKQKKHRRNKSSGELSRSRSLSSMRSVKSTGNLSDSRAASSAEQSAVEHAAMQQLASLVVQLRGDLGEATAAKEKAEKKLKQAQKQRVMSKGDSAKVSQLEQENVDLQADIDVFIAEQEDLQKEIEQLKEEKAVAKDVIKRLKKEATGGSCTSLGGSSAAASANLESKNEALESRVQELTDENHKLEKEIQLLVNEKQSFTSRDMEIDTLKKSLEEKDSQFEIKTKELHAQISELEVAKSEAEKVAREQKMNVAVVEDELEAKDKEFETESKKMTLVRQRLSQVEKQKADLKLKNESLEQVISKMEEEELSSKAVVTKDGQSNENALQELKEKVLSLELAKSKLQNELDSMKSKANTEDKEISIDSAADVERKAQQNVNKDQTGSLTRKISDLEDVKNKLESEVTEAADAIAMLEDELDSKEIQLKESLEQMTNLQQQFSTKDTRNSMLTKRNEMLTIEVEELNKQVKVLILEKKIANEEIKDLRRPQDSEMKGSETKVKDGSLPKETNQKLMEELEESADAICMLKEALTELEDARADIDNRVEELEEELKKKEIQVKATETLSSKLQSEHQVNVDTISTLQKMIQSLEKSKEELEYELNQSTIALHDAKEDIRTKDSIVLVKELERKLLDAERNNASLTGRIAELASANENVENKVKDLGNSVFTLTRRNSTDREATCDALILELKSQITELVTERDNALEAVASLKNDDTIAGVKTSLSQSKTSLDRWSPSRSPITMRLKSAPFKPAEPTGKKVASGSVSSGSNTSNQSKGLKSIESRPSKQKSQFSSSYSASSTKGSSLLDAAKKLCIKLEEKKVSMNSESESDEQVQCSLSKEEVEDNDDNSSAKEFKMDPIEPTPPSKAIKVTRSQRKHVIDQLSSIYFEKCGSEGDASKLSDLSSEGRSSPRVKKDSATTKKVKICRNGVFMGTYEGDLNTDGQRHGFGVLICDNGNSYEGEWKKDKRDGVGIARYSSGDVYDGEWTRGKRQGHGIMYIEAGDTYIGSWKNGLKHGAGTYHWADGEVDVSLYQEDRRFGEGVRWNSTRAKAYRLVRGAKKEEIGLEQAYNTAESLGLNLEKVDSSESS